MNSVRQNFVYPWQCKQPVPHHFFAYYLMQAQPLESRGRTIRHYDNSPGRVYMYENFKLKNFELRNDALIMDKHMTWSKIAGLYLHSPPP